MVLFISFINQYQPSKAMTIDQDIRRLYSGMIASGIAKVALFPLDQVKVTRRIHGRWELWPLKFEGSMISVSKMAIRQAIRFACYDGLKEQHGSLIASVLSGVIQTVITHPIESIQTYLMVHKISTRESIKILIDRGIYRGFSYNMAVSSSFVLMDKSIYESSFLSDYSPFIRGGISNSIASAFIYPIDTLYRSKLVGLKVSGLYKGLVISNISAFLYGSLQYSIYEYICRI